MQFEKVRLVARTRPLDGQRLYACTDYWLLIPNPSSPTLLLLLICDRQFGVAALPVLLLRLRLTNGKEMTAQIRHRDFTPTTPNTAFTHIYPDFLPLTGWNVTNSNSSDNEDKLCGTTLTACTESTGILFGFVPFRFPRGWWSHLDVRIQTNSIANKRENNLSKKTNIQDSQRRHPMISLSWSYRNTRTEWCSWTTTHHCPPRWRHRFKIPAASERIELAHLEMALWLTTSFIPYRGVC